MANIYGVKFDKINDYFDLDDNAAWDIIMSNGDQFYAFWLEQDTNTGADSQYWFSNNSFNAGNSVQCFVSETADTFRFNPQNATQQATTPAKTFPTGRVFIVCQYNSSTDRLEISYCEEGGLNERTVATVDLADDISSANWNLGRRQDGNSGRYYEGKIFNLAKGDTYLSNAQVEALASDFLNYDPNDEFTPAIYFPMNEGTGTTITDDVLGLTGTGIGFPGDNSQWILEGQSGGGLVISPSSITSEESFGLPVISVGGVNISPTSISSEESFGSPTVTSGANIISPTSIASAEAFGSPVISTSAIILSPSGIPSEESFGDPVIIIGAIIVSPTGITSEESFGIPVLVFQQIIFAQGITSAEAFGIPIISDGQAVIIPVEFRGTSNKIAEYLNSTGRFTSEQVNDIIVEWLKLENTSGETFNDLFYNYWETQGLNGAYTDKQDKWRNE